MKKSATPFHEKLPAPIVKALRDVQAHIQAHPDSFKMDQWANLDDEAECGTVGCICGWMAMLSLPEARLDALKASELDWELRSGTRLCNFSADSEDDPDGEIWSPMEHFLDEYKQQIRATGYWDNFERLFMDYNWPAKFVGADDSITPKKAVERIDYFLETGK